ncbi:MAG TPA: decaprenyl-phosphate phosphoribosyltransferase [Anaerolineaceae bacterium]|jgi:4-hydroxybenzoate polyprenyltransferase|nr:decaprenyl-phosphate phosphoribosyltransferase [Anaerolineaceae bacterium]HOS52921.1 decaprenyl-phosphate phosphoribosyltransferase [Anaerolineaceae bacterium]HPD62236.1 decaprenyl-phosphate phosphoribosyltransferase [Anaerolineaceae bacterium]HQF68146.1 decaprenyl-phosphate phosphoribosyltransferase [Anaerolineaceae bacterium]HQK04765.1 decaprenyl-phosphate phosphoribosyltransferase [Anaerolineaceae bacterium]
MLKYILKAMRPRQWTKNAFIFAALVFDRKLLNLHAFLQTLAAFVLFCLLSSSVYLINDILDRESDRAHPIKKNRPIASGNLPVGLALATGIFLLLVSLTGAFLLSHGFFFISLVYFTLNLIYSIWLKHIPIIDVLVIASCFVLRVAAGVSVIEVQRFSPWLYVVTTLLALYLGFGKRRAELAVLVNDSPQSHRKVLSGYSIQFIDQLITVVSATTLISYSLYTFSAPNLPENHSMMLTIPFVLYGIFRYLFLINKHNAGGEPEEILLKDRPIQLTVLLWGVAVMVIFYLF